MPALVTSLLALLLGYIALTKGPVVFAAAIATVTIAFYETLARRTDGRLAAIADKGFDRMHGGDPWTKVPAEQKLLERSLSLALKRTELHNQYPNSMIRGARLAANIGWI